MYHVFSRLKYVWFFFVWFFLFCFVLFCYFFFVVFFWLFFLGGGTRQSMLFQILIIEAIFLVSLFKETKNFDHLDVSGTNNENSFAQYKL